MLTGLLYYSDGTPIIFLDCATYPAISCRTSLQSQLPWIGSFGKVNCKPLTYLPRWNNRFEEAQMKITETSMWALPRFQGSNTVGTNICDKQIGCVLLQKQSNEADEPIRIFVFLVNDTKRAYETTDCECVSEVLALLLLRSCLRCDHFNVCSARDALRWMLSLKHTTGKLARCQKRLSHSNSTSSTANV